MSRAAPGEAARTFTRLVAVETDGCTLWPHGTSSNGYGQLAVSGVSHGVHVLACEHAHGPRPDGQQAAHRCGVKLCINPRHLRWVPQWANEADKWLHGTQGRAPGRKFTSETALKARGLA